MPLTDSLWTAEQADMASALDELCGALIDDEYLKRVDAEAAYPERVMSALREQGWATMVVPEEHGGSAASVSDIAVVLETLAEHSLVVAQAFFSMWLLGGFAIAEHGTTSQKERWLRGIAQDGSLVAFALTEPDSGSDAAALVTKATKVQGGWSVTGQKVFITGAAIADVIITAVRTSTGSGKREGITTLLVDPTADGVEIRKLSKMGLRGIDLSEVFLQSVFVPDDDVLGELDSGWNVVLDGLAIERVCLAAISVGAHADILRRCTDYALARRSFGKSLASHQLVAEKLVDIRVALDAGRALVQRAAALVDAGDSGAAIAGSIAKLHATTSYVSAAREGVQIFGGYGFTDEFAVSRHYRDCKYLEIGGGSSEIQKIIIARSMGARL
ncbi:acyl-CoA dehydrogenase family protein [Microbacterium rhizomatis]|uniref:Acyl-CoA dehydrogenase n=1 Tax=Microbacterium rhizomatis TaxID=1631477 RepID=A0A5J5IX76_9MICO|nr:acyl-CoA dehydrogenase [Microbacterium rhizomatis]